MRDYVHIKKYLVFSHYYEDNVEIKMSGVKNRMKMVCALITTYKYMSAGGKGEKANM